jgi:AcrR family transcriptional regulator
MKRAERSQRRRREMLEAYYQTLLDEGLQGASIAKIARRLEVPPSLLIHYFGTTEQMTIELVDYLLEVYHESYGDKLAAVPDPLERLHAILDEFFSPEYHQLLDGGVLRLLLREPPASAVRKSYAALYETSLELESTLECMRGHLAETTRTSSPSPSRRWRRLRVPHRRRG